MIGGLKTILVKAGHEQEFESLFNELRTIMHEKERFKFLLMSRLYENGFQPPNHRVCSFESFYHSGCLRLIQTGHYLNLEFIALGNALLLNVHFN